MQETKPTMVNNLVPNGLLCSEEIFVPKVLERSKWSQVEDRTIELLQFLEPNPKSETLRNNIVSYIKGLIISHVPVKVRKICFIFYSLIIYQCSYSYEILVLHPNIHYFLVTENISSLSLMYVF